MTTVTDTGAAARAADVWTICGRTAEGLTQSLGARISTPLIYLLVDVSPPGPAIPSKAT